MKNHLPVMLLKGLVLLPHQEVRLELNNDLSRKVIDLVGKDYNDRILVICPLDQMEESPDVTDLPNVGVVGKIKARIELPNGNLRIVITGIERVKIDRLYNIKEINEILFANVTKIELPKFDEIEEMSRFRKLMELFKKYIKRSSNMSNSAIQMVNQTKDLDCLTDIITSLLPITIDKKINYMLELNALKRSESLIKDLQIDLEILALDKKIEKDLSVRLDSGQKEFILKEKVKQIQKELGEENYKDVEVTNYLEILSKLNIDNKTEIKIRQEIKKYEYTNDFSPESANVKTYLDTILSLPWNKLSKDESSLKKISNSLDKTHYGLDKVKSRIIEYIAVKTRNPEIISPIICLVGPPGVGKTTLASSIASALNKEFYKISVGGLNDSNELIGHRRAYLGASPGKIINALKKCGTSNPVLLIDEIDKMVKDYKGDPASTLLDVLDVNQNKRFTDNFIEEPFDLSKILFILTANNEFDIPRELLDRLEIIKLDAYSSVDKIDIANKYLIPKIYLEHKITIKDLVLKDNIISSIIKHYTKESGVRELERQISTIVRKYVTEEIKTKKHSKKTVKLTDLNIYLGHSKYDNELIKYKECGVTNAMAATNYGGTIMPIEVSLFKGKGDIISTGNLGKVISESLTVAIGYIKSNNKLFNIDPKVFEENNIQIHFLEGAVSKDGPSAGICITTALLSNILEVKINSNIAFTGEISLKGNVLPVGAIKEKVIAAYNEDITEIILPKRNEKDLDDIPSIVLKSLKINLVNNYSEVYKLLFK